MNRNIKELKKILGAKDNNKSYSVLNNKLMLFEQKNVLKIPPDLSDYFKLLDNAVNQLDKDLYEFYPFDNFKSIEKGLVHWGPVPNYGNIVNTLSQAENCFVFADYMSNLFAYAIRLYKENTDVNEVYLICGDKYKVLATSFSGFIELYLHDSIELKTI